MNTQSKIEQMEREIQRLKDKAKILEDWQAKVHTLDSFTPEEKCSVFDELYKQARFHLEQLVASGYYPKDGDHYIYEAVMSKCLGSKVWEVTRAVLR